jgi:hypothetical protein
MFFGDRPSLGLDFGGTLAPLIFYSLLVCGNAEAESRTNGSNTSRFRG